MFQKKIPADSAALSSRKIRKLFDENHRSVRQNALDSYFSSSKNNKNNKALTDIREKIKQSLLDFQD